MRALVLCLLLAPAVVHSQTSAGADANAALHALAECSETAGDQVAGAIELETACPGLDAALSELGYTPFISFNQSEQLTADSLSDLHALIARYERSPDAIAHAPDPQALPAILATLREAAQAEAPLSWFDKLKRWLRERLSPREDAADSWLTRWLDQFEINPSVAEVIVVACIVLVILLALAVLINELRVAGVFRERSRRRREREAEGAFAHGEDAPSWAELDRLPPADRPSFALRMLVAALVRSGRLRSERNLTHRELSARAKLDDEAQRACLTRIAMLAEKVVYGGAGLDADGDAAIAQGRELHARLSAGTT